MQKFSEIPYVRPDFGRVKKEYLAQTARLKKAATYAEAREAYLAMQQIESGVETTESIVYVRSTMDTTDRFYERELAFMQKQSALLMPILKKGANTLLTHPQRPAFEAEFGAQIFRLTEASVKLSSRRIIRPSIREQKLCTEYSKIAAGCQTDFRGEKCNFYGLLKHMQTSDRAERRAAYEAWAKLYEDASGRLDDVYDKLIALRVKQAGRLGFSSYTEMAYLARNRFDYAPADAARFREQVRLYVTPIVERIYKAQAARLGVDKLKYYDEQLFYPEGNPTPHASTKEMIDAAQEMYHSLSAETGAFFDFMKQYELFDLETRPGKHLGGYSTELPDYKAPFIFSNFNGTSADVDVLTHEAGHAFQSYLGMRGQTLSRYTASTAEIDEIHSMTMEHFTYPWMNLFFGEDAERYRRFHLAGSLATIPYLVSVDEFQHRVYEKPEMTASERRGVWREIEKRYMPWRDYDGNAFLEGGGFWMQKQHIFLYPFYYVDYALAQICAHQLFLRMRDNRDEAWNDYLNLCKAGGSRGYFELLSVARLDNPFAEGTVQKTAEAIGRLIEA